MNRRYFLKALSVLSLGVFVPAALAKTEEKLPTDYTYVKITENGEVLLFPSLYSQSSIALAKRDYVYPKFNGQVIAGCQEADTVNGYVIVFDRNNRRIKRKFYGKVQILLKDRRNYDVMKDAVHLI
jgi:hypothetical protein